MASRGCPSKLAAMVGRINRTENPPVDYKRHAGGLSQRGLWNCRGGAHDGGPNGLYLQAKRGIGRIGCTLIEVLLLVTCTW